MLYTWRYKVHTFVPGARRCIAHATVPTFGRSDGNATTRRYDGNADTLITPELFIIKLHNSVIPVRICLEILFQCFNGLNIFSTCFAVSSNKMLQIVKLPIHLVFQVLFSLIGMGLLQIFNLCLLGHQLIIYLFIASEF